MMLNGLNALLWVGAVTLALWAILQFMWMFNNLRSHFKDWRKSDLHYRLRVEDLTARVYKIEKRLKDKNE